MAGIQRYFFASMDSLGNSPLCSLHQTKGSASLSMLLKSKYDSSSETTSCSGWDGVSLPFAALRKLPKVFRLFFMGAAGDAVEVELN